MNSGKKASSRDSHQLFFCGYAEALKKSFLVVRFTVQLPLGQLCPKPFPPLGSRQENSVRLFVFTTSVFAENATDCLIHVFLILCTPDRFACACSSLFAIFPTAGGCLLRVTIHEWPCGCGLCPCANEASRIPHRWLPPSEVLLFGATQLAWVASTTASKKVKGTSLSARRTYSQRSVLQSPMT